MIREECLLGLSGRELDQLINRDEFGTAMPIRGFNTAGTAALHQ